MIVSIGKTDCINLTFTKCSAAYGEEEYWYLKDPSTGTTLYESWIPGDFTTETQTHCVPIPSSYVYDLIFPNLFYVGSWLEIKGPYGQIFYKGENRLTAIAVSVYTPIEKLSTWNVLLHRELHWTDLNWDSSGSTALVSSSLPSWNTANNDNPRRMFLRKEFTTLSDLSAYEFRFKYKYGIIAYMNGHEVYRDNLPAGYLSEEIPSSTIGFYYSYDFRGVIRNAGELNAMNVLSIEIYSQEVINEFDGWLSMYGSSWQKDHTARIYYHPTSAYIGSEPFNHATDFDSDSYVYADGNDSGTDAYLDYDIRGQINSVLYVVVDSGAMSRFVVTGTTLDGNTLKVVDQTIEAEYDSEVIYNFELTQHNFKKVRIHGYSSSNYLQFNELIPVIRRTQVTFPSYPTTQLTYSYSIYEQINENLGDHFCQLMPTQVTGLIVSDNCMISGSFTSPGTKVVSVMVFVSDEDIMNISYVTLTFTVDGTPTEQPGNGTGNLSSTMIIIGILVVIVVILVIILLIVFSKRSKTQLPVQSTQDLPKTTNTPMVSTQVPNPVGMTPQTVNALVPPPPPPPDVNPQIMTQPNGQLPSVVTVSSSSQPMNTIVTPMLSLATTTPFSQSMGSVSQSMPIVSTPSTMVQVPSSNPLPQQTIHPALQMQYTQSTPSISQSYNNVQTMNPTNQMMLNPSVIQVQQTNEVPINQNTFQIPPNAQITMMPYTQAIPSTGFQDQLSVSHLSVQTPLQQHQWLSQSTTSINSDIPADSYDNVSTHTRPKKIVIINKKTNRNI